jgi:hypothetical protein
VAGAEGSDAPAGAALVNSSPAGRAAGRVVWAEAAAARTRHAARVRPIKLLEGMDGSFLSIRVALNEILGRGL